jgi:1-pyrroline-4-hydroxy-2-carboxylate deaminase
VLGTVGENCSLRPEEKRKVLSAAKEVVNGRIPILSGVAEFTTAEAAQYARDAAKIGIDGLMALPGMVYKSDTRETLQHFRTVARASDLPIMIYNNPPVYGVDVKPETFAELASEKTIVAIKESSDDPRRITDLHNLYGDRFVLFCGVDDLLLESCALGIEGWVSGLTDVFPEESVELWTLCQAGRFAEARALYRWFTPLLHLDTSSKLVQYIKLGQQVVGLGSEKVRSPRLELAGEERAQIIALYEKAIATRPKLATRPKSAVA